MTHEGGPVYQAGFTTTRPAYYKCHCKFETTSRFRWWLHRVRSWPFK